MKRQKHEMGVEVPSFFEYQRRKAAEKAATDADAAAAAAAASRSKKQGFFDALFAPEHKPTTQQPQVPPSPPPVIPGSVNWPPPFVDANQYFEVAPIWNRVVTTIADYGNRDFVIDILTPPIYNATRAERDFQAAAEIAQFFGIPGSRFQGLTLQQSWENVIGPFFYKLEESINRARPFGILGSIHFELDPNTNQLELAYRTQ